MMVLFFFTHTADIRGPKTASGDGGPYIFHRQLKFKDRDCSNKAWPAGKPAWRCERVRRHQTLSGSDSGTEGGSSASTLRKSCVKCSGENHGRNGAIWMTSLQGQNKSVQKNVETAQIPLLLHMTTTLFERLDIVLMHFLCFCQNCCHALWGAFVFGVPLILSNTCCCLQLYVFLLLNETMHLPTHTHTHTRSRPTRTSSTRVNGQMTEPTCLCGAL
jgi:hypothetical protein